MAPSPPPEFGTCLGDLYSVAWMENADASDLTIGGVWGWGGPRGLEPAARASLPGWRAACCSWDCQLGVLLPDTGVLPPLPDTHPHPPVPSRLPANPAETLKKQFQLVKARVSRNFTYTQGSHVMRFGSFIIGEEPAAEFEGGGNIGGRRGGGAWGLACLAPGWPPGGM